LSHCKLLEFYEYLHICFADPEEDLSPERIAELYASLQETRKRKKDATGSGSDDKKSKAKGPRVEIEYEEEEEEEGPQRSGKMRLASSADYNF
jgi:hypothetical protein